jgi:hypothetical protein
MTPAAVPPIIERPPDPGYWPAVTDAPCPCGGVIRWAEAGYVPGWRQCDRCGRHWIATGDAEAPRLELAALCEDNVARPWSEALAVDPRPREYPRDRGPYAATAAELEP